MIKANRYVILFNKLFEQEKTNILVVSMDISQIFEYFEYFDISRIFGTLKSKIYKKTCYGKNH